MIVKVKLKVKESASVVQTQTQSLILVRRFVAYRVKWVVDRYLDYIVWKERNLQPALKLCRHILKAKHKTLPLREAALLHPNLNITEPLLHFIRRNPYLFSLSSLSNSQPHHSFRLTTRAAALFSEDSSHDPFVSAERLSRLLSLAGANRAPISLIAPLAWDLGLPDDFVTSLIMSFPDLFALCHIKNQLGVELVRPFSPVSELQRRAPPGEKFISFPMKFARRYYLPDKVLNWVRQWQAMPYMSPYEMGHHFKSVNEDMAEKWNVAVLHELVWLTVGKKVNRESAVRYMEWLGIGRIATRWAVVHHPGIFYYSNKLRTQTVVLREAYQGERLLYEDPIMEFRYHYIKLLHKNPLPPYIKRR